MSRSATLRRHAPTAGLITLTAAAVIPFGGNSVESSPEWVTAPLGAVLLAGVDALPPLGERAGALVVAMMLAPLAALGGFFAVWRMTRNRAVSCAAGLVAVVQPAVAALDDRSAVLALALLTVGVWALAVQVGPAPVSPRFPNRPATRFRRAAMLLLVLAALLSPSGFLIAPLLVVADLVWHRDEHRDIRAWLSYAPYGLVFLVGALVFGLRSSGVESPADLWRGLIAPARSGAATLWWVVFLAMVAIAALALIADVGFGIGRRRTLVRFGAFAFGWAGLGVGLQWLLGLAGDAALLLPTMGFGLGVFASVFGWRLVTWALPPRADESSGGQRPAVPAWSELRAHFDLTPVPAVAYAPDPARPAAPEASVPAPPARLPLESLLARIESPLLGVEEGMALVRFREDVRPLVPEGGRILEFTPHGRFSPYSGTLAALGARTRLIVPTRDGGEPASEEFRDIAGVVVQGVPDDGTWALGEEAADFVFFGFSLGTIDPEAARRVLERLVGAVAPGGRLVGRVAPELRALLGLDGMTLALLARDRGLLIEVDDEDDGFLHWRRARA